MKRATVAMLACPLCKGGLQAVVDAESDDEVVEGRLLCGTCGREYPVRDGIPMMYVADEEVFVSADSHEFSELVVTPDNLDRLSARAGRGLSRLGLGSPGKALVMLAWVGLLAGVVLLVVSVFVDSSVLLPLAYVVIGAAVILFVMEYIWSRASASARYVEELHRLKKLSEARQLGEYYVHVSATDTEEGSESQFQTQKMYAAAKGDWVASLLGKRLFDVGKALNVGCGGRLTVSASKPYFERGYEVIGLDVSEEYLRDYRREYGCDVIQANGVALPFRSGSFDLVNFTDILEHLHHPLVGLGEVHRVLKDGGVIILVTPNRHTIEGRNPLVPIEKAVSLCQDSILRPRRILEQWMGLDLYHTEFSRREIEGMIKAAGLETWGFETRFFVDSMVWRAMNAAFRRLPVLRHMCWSSAVIAKKSMAPSKP